MKNDKAEQARIEVRSYYVRERHAMALRADLKPLYVDVYLHLMQHDVELEPEHAELLKDGLAAMVLHLTSRPWDEITAWTLLHLGLGYGVIAPLGIEGHAQDERGVRVRDVIEQLMLGTHAREVQDEWLRQQGETNA